MTTNSLTEINISCGKFNACGAHKYVGRRNCEQISDNLRRLFSEFLRKTLIIVNVCVRVCTVRSE